MVAHAAIGEPVVGARAFTLGAVVSPTDALAATEIARRVGAPRRVVSIIEGESLLNDGIALVLYKTAVTAAVAGTFSLWDASWRLVVNVIGGIAVGLAVGWVVRQVRRRVDDTPDRGGARVPLGLPRVPAGSGPRRLRGAGGGDDRRVHGLVYARS